MPSLHQLHTHMPAFRWIFGLIPICILGMPNWSNASIDHTETETSKGPSASDTDEKAHREIVVTAHPYGEAEIAAETEFNESDIAARGADNIQGLLAKLQSLIDPTGQQPVFLINGKPVGFDRSILSYPPEALARVAILKPEASAHYGAAPGGRVINLVLKRKFASIEVGAGLNFATAGGQYGGDLSATRTAINGDFRWNLTAQIGRQGALLRSSRDLPGNPYAIDGVGYLTATNGQPLSGSERHPIDPDKFRTLLPASNSKALRLGVAHSIGNISASFNLDATRDESEAATSIPEITLNVPATNPWSTFGEDVLLTRPFAGLHPLHNRNSRESLGIGLTLTGKFAGMQSSFAANFMHSDSRDRRETGVDTARLQQLINANDATVSPFGILSEDFLEARENRTRVDNFLIRFNLQKNFLKVPAGKIAWALSGSFGHAQSLSIQNGNLGSEPSSNRFNNTQLDSQISVNLPISHRNSGFSAFGDLDIGFTIGRQKMKGNAAQLSTGAVMAWRPFKTIQIGGSMSQTRVSPTTALLYGPIVTTVSRVFDYTNQRVVEVNWLTGGNPDLRPGNSRNMTMTVAIQPFLLQAVAFNMNYTSSVTKGAPGAFPDLTPAIEAALPERITRNAAGQLVAIDARAINIERNENSDLSTGLSLNLTGSGRRALAAPPKAILLNPTVINISFNYRLHLANKLIIRRDLSEIDRIRDGGQTRDSLNVGLSVSKRALGASLNADWSRKMHVVSADQIYLITPPIRLGFNAYVNLDQVRWLTDAGPMLKGLKLSVNVQNLLNGYQRITLSDGRVFAGMSRYELDPLGRSVGLTLNKRF